MPQGALVARLEQAEAQHRKLVVERDQIEDDAPMVKVDWRRVEREVRQRLAKWRDELGREVVDAR